MNWNPILDCVRIFMINTEKLKALIDEVAALDESEFPYDLWMTAQTELENAENVLRSDLKTQQSVNEAFERLSAAADALYGSRENMEALYDDFGGGMDLKTFSRSNNLRTEDVGAPYFPEEKTCVLRSDQNPAELVYRVGGDIAGFEIDSYLESWNQNEGLITLFLSQNGETFTEFESVEEKISRTTTGGGEYGKSVLKNSGRIPDGTKFIKIKLAGTDVAGVDWNPILSSVRLFSYKAEEVESFSVLNSALKDANGTLSAGKHYLRVSVNNLCEDKSYFCAIALYSLDRLIDFSAGRINIDKNSLNGGAIEAEDDVSVSVSGDLTDKKIKAFIWSGENLAPVMPEIVLSSK